MKKEINFGIGFITGRPNICKIINNYYQYLLEQVENYDVKVNITIFILYDLTYQFTTRIDFYGILPEVYKNINIKYITPEAIDEDKKKIMSKFDISKEDADLLLGKGYAKARNTIMYYALKRNIDYLLFWDDDEYPLASIKEGKELEWVKQTNILEHIKHIDKAEVTMGYRCGFMNPLPHIEYNDEITEEDYKKFIDGLENEVMNWEVAQKARSDSSNLSYAERDIAEHTKKPEYLENVGKTSFVLGSGICLNLTHLDKIPAFYNPPGARGQDTFFSCALALKNASVLRVPTYHFHDCFLKFTSLMKDKFPKVLRRIALDDNGIEQRFLKTTIGWTKYKPLLYYITENENYKKIIQNTKKNLEESVPKINTAFETCDFACLIKELEDYDKNVKKHYKEFLRTTEVWDDLKYKIVEEVKEYK